MPAHFAILRVAKLKSLGNVGGSLAHTYRTRETPNADPSRADQNEHSHATPGEVMQALRDKLPEKRRKDAVIGLEYFVGGSPEWFEGKTCEQQGVMSLHRVREGLKEERTACINQIRGVLTEFGLVFGAGSVWLIAGTRPNRMRSSGLVLIAVGISCAAMPYFSDWSADSAFGDLLILLDNAAKAA